MPRSAPNAALAKAPPARPAVARPAVGPFGPSVPMALFGPYRALYSYMGPYGPFRALNR